MSARFMNIKRVVIPTITALIIASQLVGCAGAQESELLQMINNGQAITIEIADQNNSVEATTEFRWISVEGVENI